MVAFLEGPVVLAGLTSEEMPLRTNGSDPATAWFPTTSGSLTSGTLNTAPTGQDRELRFIPLHEVTDEAFAVSLSDHPVAFGPINPSR